MALIHLIYVSTAREEFDETELARILDTAVRRNGERNVTGMLLYAGGTFMQVLEGRRTWTRLSPAFARIIATPASFSSNGNRLRHAASRLGAWASAASAPPRLAPVPATRLSLPGVSMHPPSAPNPA